MCRKKSLLLGGREGRKDAGYERKQNDVFYLWSALRWVA
ncbi:conserved hypothetical protein [Treponema pallidum subsp. pallidum str. Chicago]|nr:conserved hypothetical protein [Treponema pallidum subsp. pallidum str. Chicago]